MNVRGVLKKWVEYSIYKSRMPRFSDIFVYHQVSPELTVFNTCYLLKKVGVHESGSKIDQIHFDIQGMVLFFVIDRDTTGPYVLTTNVF